MIINTTPKTKQPTKRTTGTHAKIAAKSTAEIELVLLPVLGGEGSGIGDALFCPGKNNTQKLTPGVSHCIGQCPSVFSSSSNQKLRRHSFGPAVPSISFLAEGIFRFMEIGFCALNCQSGFTL